MEDPLTSSRAGFRPEPDDHTAVYLSRPQVAERLGVARGTLNRYRLPAPDVVVGERGYGWSVETIDRWNAARPSRRTE